MASFTQLCPGGEIWVLLTIPTELILEASCEAGRIYQPFPEAEEINILQVHLTHLWL
jgi:hypothetical protein